MRICIEYIIEVRVIFLLFRGVIFYVFFGFSGFVFLVSNEWKIVMMEGYIFMFF